MNELSVLTYTPPWHLHGDPDELLYSILYGVVALATIWLLEHICELVLFSSTNGILLSDAAAHLALNNSNWWDIVKWVFQTRRKSRLCRRAFLALCCRCLLVAVDVGILLQAVPSNINVYENEVGSTELSFAPNSSRILNSNPTLDSAGISCKPDVIRYGGFTPTATRTICMISIPNRSMPVTNTSITTFYFLSVSSRLRILSSRLADRYLFQHSTRLIGGQDGNEEDLVIRADRDIAELAPQAAMVTSEIEHIAGWNCTPKRTSEISAILNCSNSPSYGIAANLHSLVILNLFDRVGTVKMKPNGTSYLVQGRKGERNLTTDESLPAKPLETHGLGPRIGIIRRPKLCIFPATILLGALGLVAILLRLFMGSHDFAWKLWLFLAISAGVNDVNTLFDTKCSEIRLFTRIGCHSDDGHDFVRRTFNGLELDIEERPTHLSDIPEEYEIGTPNYWTIRNLDHY